MLSELSAVRPPSHVTHHPSPVIGLTSHPSPVTRHQSSSPVAAFDQRHGGSGRWTMRVMRATIRLAVGVAVTTRHPSRPSAAAPLPPLTHTRTHTRGPLGAGLGEGRGRAWVRRWVSQPQRRCPWPVRDAARAAARAGSLSSTRSDAAAAALPPPAPTAAGEFGCWWIRE